MFKRFKKTSTLAAALLGVTLMAQSVPAHAEQVYVAKEGDTFYKLSQRYDIDLETLMNANKNISPYNIYEGLKLTLPTKSSESSSSNNAVTASLSVDSSNKVVEAWGKTFNYSETLNVKATAYSSDPAENGGYGAVDYFGNPLELGTIAVDPSVIPLGTKVLVTGHSHDNLPDQAFVATATDIGGAIKGNKIDIFIPGSKSSVAKFGIQDVKLYIIE
ncbi:3D domain-containing protein [Paenibacillus gallinarum]|uniref:LysM peptidoglycan-binding domain-containing protein n=1 Tax=Paenibacillus gallinarum TaxID=2762232 RepID=A0ABR8SXI1_9BACL|nr:3D domain-containing protein [Paenibacillus gallinarum]MBD7968216.1 LysM peptidoglycan-binding domain-containing protein [Paenibacillus gallinarum]